MSTTTAPTREVTYEAKCPNQELILAAGDVERDARGMTIRPIPRVAVRFSKHVATLREDNGQVLCNGAELEMPFDDVVRRIENHRFFGSRIYRAGAAPDAPRPTVDEMLAEINKADANKLRELHAQEAATHNRPAVLSAITQAALTSDDAEDDGESGDTG